MSSRISSSDHLPVIALPDTEASMPPPKSVAALRVIFDSSSHQNLLAAAEKAKSHFETLATSENIPSAVTGKIILNERSAANNFSASALNAKSQAIPIINTLRYQCHDQELLSTVAALELRLKRSTEQAVKSSTDAAAATQKQAVQIDAKSAAFHAADAQLALAQLKQLEPQCSAQTSQGIESDLKKAATNYQQASKELSFLLKKVSSDIEVATDIDIDSLDSNGETSETTSKIDAEDEPPDLGNGTWREVSDEEAALQHQQYLKWQASLDKLLFKK